MTIHKAGIGDIETIRKLGIDTYREHFSHIWTEKGISAYLNSQFNLDNLAQELSGDLIKYFIAKVDNTTAGFMKLKLNSALPGSPEEQGIELEKIYLLRVFAGKGFGSKMIRFAINLAKKKRIGFIWLDSLKTNLPAIRLYERCGFKIVGELNFYTDKTKPDMWVMKIDLPQKI